MKKFITAVLLVVVEASVAEVDTVEFKLGGYKIQVPLNRPIPVTRVKSADLADFHRPPPVARLAELLTSAAHSAVAAAPLPVPLERRPPRLPPVNRFPGTLQQTADLEPHPSNSLFPSPNPTKHNFQKQQPLSYGPEQHSVSYYEKQHHGAHTPKNSFQSPRPDQRYLIALQSLSINNGDSTLPNVQDMLPNNRYPATEHSENNKFPTLQSPDSNYPEPFPPHRNPETLATNQHYAPSYYRNYTYPTPSLHHSKPQSHNRPEPQLRSSPLVEYSSQRIDTTQQPESSRTWSIAPRATQQGFPEWLRSQGDPGLTEHVTSTEPDVSTTETVITTTVPDVPMTTAEHVTSTTGQVTTMAVPLTGEFKSTTEPVINTAVSDVTMITAEQVTPSFKEFIQVHNPVLSPDVVTSGTKQVVSPFKDFTSEKNVTKTAAKRMSLPKNITSKAVSIMKIEQMTLSEPTVVRGDPVTKPVPAVTTNTATKVSEKEVFSVPKVVIIAAEQMASQTEKFNYISMSAKTKDLIIIATEAASGTGTTTSDTTTLRTILPSPSTITSTLPQTPSTRPLRPNRSTSDPALLLTIPVQHIPLAFATMTTPATPLSTTNSTETFTEPSTAAATMSAIVLKKTLKGSGLRRGVTSTRDKRATRAMRATRATRATPGAATLVPCVRAPRKSRYRRKRNRGSTASERKAGPARRHGETRAARARALSKRPPRAHRVPDTYTPRDFHGPATRNAITR